MGECKCLLWESWRYISYSQWFHVNITRILVCSPHIVYLTFLENSLMSSFSHMYANSFCGYDPGMIWHLDQISWSRYFHHSARQLLFKDIHVFGQWYILALTCLYMLLFLGPWNRQCIHKLEHRIKIPFVVHIVGISTRRHMIAYS